MVDIDVILEECKLRYYIGIEFISPYSGHLFKSKSNPIIRDFNIMVITDTIEAYIYYEGKFAEVVSIPEIKLINDFSIW